MALMQEQVALITGAQRGVGFGIAREMIDAGADAVSTDIDAGGVAQPTEQLGGSASGLVADVTDRASMDSAVAEVVSRHGRLDAVVANAGVGSSAPSVKSLKSNSTLSMASTSRLPLHRPSSVAAACVPSRHWWHPPAEPVNGG
jgi:NAD(P)-dependent dehydrogenase (short-subunit alcohol dehydrogenase family)